MVEDKFDETLFDMGIRGDHCDDGVGVTYILHATEVNRIKIGRSRNFSDRRNQTDSPVELVLLGLFRGVRHERELHRRCKRWRRYLSDGAMTEWFNPTSRFMDVLCSYIEQNRECWIDGSEQFIAYDVRIYGGTPIDHSLAWTYSLYRDVLPLDQLSVLWAAIADRCKMCTDKTKEYLKSVMALP